MYQDRISFGLTLGIPKVEYEETSMHTEEVNAVTPTLQRWEYNESLRVTGRGYLLRFGVLARVSESLRVGLAYQTRSRLTLTDTYNTDLQTTWLDDSQFRAVSPTSNAEYLVFTPDRTTVSASFLLGKLGVLNADYVRSDMRRGELGESNGILALDYDFKPENDAVQQGYRVVHQARVGLELRVGENDEFRIRGGGGMSTSRLFRKPSNPTPTATMPPSALGIALPTSTSAPRGELHGTARTSTSWEPSLPNPWPPQPPFKCAHLGCRPQALSAGCGTRKRPTCWRAFFNAPDADVSRAYFFSLAISLSRSAFMRVNSSSANSLSTKMRPLCSSTMMRLR